MNILNIAADKQLPKTIHSKKQAHYKKLIKKIIYQKSFNHLLSLLESQTAKKEQDFHHFTIIE